MNRLSVVLLALLVVIAIVGCSEPVSPELTSGGFRSGQSPSGDVLFSDDFESGTFSKWDYVGGFQCTPPCGVSINSDPAFVHSGNYSARFFYNIPANFGDEHQDDNEFMAKVFSPIPDEVWFRGWVYFKSPEPGGDRQLDSGRKLVGWQNDSNNSWFGYLTSESVGYEFNTITPKFQMKNPPLTVDTGFYSSQRLQFDRWHCVETHWKWNTPPNVPDGVVDVWVDGVSGIHLTNVVLRTTVGGDRFVLAFGYQSDRTNRRSTKEFRYWDDIMISTAGRIGCGVP